MFVVRGTKKFRDRVKDRSNGAASSENEVGTNSLGDWYVTVLYWRPQVALFVSSKTLLPVFLPLAPSTSVVDRFPDALRALVDSFGYGAWFDAVEAPQMTEYRIDRTNSRSVLGSMNDFVHQCDIYRRSPQRDNLLELSRMLAHTPCSPLFGRTGFPDLELEAVVNAQ